MQIRNEDIARITNYEEMQRSLLLQDVREFRRIRQVRGCAFTMQKLANPIDQIGLI